MAEATKHPETAKLAVELQLDDIRDLLDGLYDDEDLPESDAHTSLQIMQTDLQDSLQILEGQVLTLKILREEHENRVAFAKLLEEEKQAAEDHRLAMQLSGLAVSDHDDSSDGEDQHALCSTNDYLDDEQWDTAKELYAKAFETERASRACTAKFQSKCCACMDVFPCRDTLTLECQPEGHTYCQGCLVDLFRSSIHNTALFPPRCCNITVPLEICRALLPKELIKEFDLKVEELATPNPTYCSNGECSSFIRPSEIKADVGSCVFCKTRTCIRCKSPEHTGLCPSDPHVQLLMDVAKRSKWQQCSNCKNMVELEQGCFHMTCVCKHEFCYLCGLQWKPVRACTCPQWDEDYLTRAVPAAPVPAPAPAPAPATNTPHVHEWQRVNGLDCEECGADYLKFAMRCSDCSLAKCWRCIDSRE